MAVGATLVFAQAAAAVGSGDRRSLYWAGRATLVKRPEDAVVYDRVFRAYWDGRAVPATEAVRQELTLVIEDDELPDDADGVDPDEPGEPRPRCACGSVPTRCCATRTSPPAPRPSWSRRNG